jgi:hypothetical protein
MFRKFACVLLVACLVFGGCQGEMPMPRQDNIDTSTPSSIPSEKTTVLPSHLPEGAIIGFGEDYPIQDDSLKVFVEVFKTSVVTKNSEPLKEYLSDDTVLFEDDNGAMIQYEYSGEAIQEPLYSNNTSYSYMFLRTIDIEDDDNIKMYFSCIASRPSVGIDGATLFYYVYLRKYEQSWKIVKLEGDI